MSIRKLTADTTTAELREERIFTLARLEDEADVAHLAVAPTAWIERIDALDLSERELAEEAVRISAALTGANLALDTVCSDFSDRLLEQVDERVDARYRTFFATTVTDFNRGEYATQTKTVRGWLTTSRDSLLEEMRPQLEKATARSERALAREQALEVKRGERWQVRQAVATALTEERDVLHDALAKHARANKLPRTFAASFFRKGDSGAKAPKAPTQG